MATRHNTCPNPACSVNTTGWGGGSAPTRVTGLTGYSRTTGARYTGGTFIQTPTGAAGPGDVVTISLDILTEVFSDPSIDLYMFATRSAGGDVQIGAIDHPTLTNGVVSRFAITRTCPALTTGVYVIVDSINMGLSPTVATAVLTEVAASAGAYFDGDTSGGSWDGTVGLSASTLADAAADVTLTATLPALSGAFVVGTLSDITLAGVLPALVGHFTDATVPGHATITAARPAAGITASRSVSITASRPMATVEAS